MTTQERLARLAWQSRRLTMGFVLVGLVAVLAVTMGMKRVNQAPEAVKAGRFELVDTSGNMRGALALSNSGSPILCLYDDKDALKPRASFGAYQGGPCLMLYREGSIQAAAAVQLVNSFDPSVQLSDSMGKPRAGLWLKDRCPRLAMLDANGEFLIAERLDPAPREAPQQSAPAGMGAGVAGHTGQPAQVDPNRAMRRYAERLSGFMGAIDAPMWNSGPEAQADWKRRSNEDWERRRAQRAQEERRAQEDWDRRNRR